MRFCVVIKLTTTRCDNNHSTTTAAIVATVSSFTASGKIVLMRMNIVGTNSTSIISMNFSIFKFSTGEFKMKIMTGGVLLRYPTISPIYYILYTIYYTQHDTILYTIITINYSLYYTLLFIIYYLLFIIYYPSTISPIQSI